MTFSRRFCVRLPRYNRLCQRIRIHRYSRTSAGVVSHRCLANVWEGSCVFNLRDGNVHACYESSEIQVHRPFSNPVTSTLQACCLAATGVRVQQPTNPASTSDRRLSTTGKVVFQAENVSAIVLSGNMGAGKF